jgi:hypothetical protein
MKFIMKRILLLRRALNLKTYINILIYLEGVQNSGRQVTVATEYVRVVTKTFVSSILNFIYIVVHRPKLSGGF